MRPRTLLFALLVPTVAVATAWARQVPPAADSAHTAMLRHGHDLVGQGRPAEAIAQCLDPLLAEFEARYGAASSRIYCAGSPAEGMLYLTEAAKDKVEAVVLADTWADASFLKGYALVDLGRWAEAKVALDRAVTLAPRRPTYLIELGNWYQHAQDWPTSLGLFLRAEDAVRTLATGNPDPKSLTRTWRGQGYALTEMGRLEESTRLYQRCLDLDPRDAKAKDELAYIQKLKDKGTAL